MSELRVSLKPVAPFRLDLTAWALRRRLDNIVDLWDGARYSRIFAIENRAILVSLRQTRGPERPEVELSAISPGRFTARDKETLVAAVERMMGMRRDLSEFYRLTRNDPHIGPLVKRYLGLKPPRFPTVFEALANAIACQQLTILVGITLLNRLADRFGARLPMAPCARSFPSPRDLIEAHPNEIRRLGFSNHKTRALLELARQCDGASDARLSLEKLSDEEAVARMIALRGIGRWSAQYALLRGLGRLNVFPVDDIAGQKNLRHWMRLRSTPSSERAEHLLSRWSPYQGFLYFHFLLANLESKGLIEVNSPTRR